MRIIVTAKSRAIDVDVLASSVSYSELLNLEGKESMAVIIPDFTASITPSILNLGFKYRDNYVSDGKEVFVLVDTSDPGTLPSFVDLDRIIEVYDHRSGFEEHWKNRLNEKSHIEMVGACGTLIWEEFQKRGKSEKISISSSKLLLASIVSNTLNFKSLLTTQRDKQAYLELSNISGLTEKWILKYFLEQEKVLMEDFNKYLKADTKIITIGSDKLVMGQIELWDSDQLLEENRDMIDKVMQEYDPIPWMVSIQNISKGVLYIYAQDINVKKMIGDKLGLIFKGNLATTDKLLQRKHITRILQN